MSTKDQLKKQVNRRYTDVYLKRKYSDGSFDTDWIDISRYVLRSGLASIRYKLDSDDYDVGIFVVNNITMEFNNQTGKFNDNSDSRSLWGGFEEKHLSKVKIESGYLDSDEEKIEEIVFQGILDERTIDYSDNDSVRILILANESVFSSVSVIPGTLSSAILASEAIFVLCSRSEITNYMNVALSNIDPENDIIIDNPNAFDSQKLDQVLNEISLITNSVLYIDGSNNLIVTPRNESNNIKYRFYLNSESGKTDNIYKIRGLNSGRHRVKNDWRWSGAALSAASDSNYLKKFGTTAKTISSSSVSITATQQAILDNLRDEWQFPKREVSIETDYLANEITFFDLVTLDVRPSLSRLSNLPICGYAVAGTDQCIVYTTGIKIPPNIGFKILSIEHNLNASKTVLKLREIGNQLNDGYLPMVNSKIYEVSFVSESTKTIVTSGDGLNAQKCKVEILDSDSDYSTEDMQITRPDSDSIVLTTGSPVTLNLRVLVVEVLE